MYITQNSGKFPKASFLTSVDISSPPKKKTAINKPKQLASSNLHLFLQQKVKQPPKKLLTGQIEPKKSPERKIEIKIEAKIEIAPIVFPNKLDDRPDL